MSNKRKLEFRSGSALILTTILLFVILGMVVSLTYVTVMEQKMSQKTKSSVTSFYNAESGVEWILNKIASSSGEIGDTLTMNSDSTISCPDSFGGNECKIYLLDKDGNVITASTADFSEVKAVRSVGSQGQETQRAIEAAVAAAGGGCYVDYSLDTGLAVGTSCGAVGGFTIKRSAGTWGRCGGSDNYESYYDRAAYFNPPGAGSKCPSAWGFKNLGEAYVCCQN